MSEPPTTSTLPRSSIVVLTFVLMLLYILIRLPGTMALPIFGDEAIYIRWADLLRQGYPWACLVDPKPPLHFWLMALPLGWAADPLAAGRGVSIVAGLLTIPAALALCVEIGYLIREPAQSAGTKTLPTPGGRSLGLIFAMLLIFCPFLAFYQRMALADGLFVLEMVVALWLSLRWARGVAGNTARRGLTANTVLLGVVMAAAMLTRQGVSYVLWGMPVVALLLHCRSAGTWRRVVRGSLSLGAALALALVLWSPYLVANLDGYVTDARAEYVIAHPHDPVPSNLTLQLGELKRRILYQGHFTETKDRAALALRNVRLTFGCAWTPPVAAGQDQAEPGWFWLYLTPGVYAAGLLGIVWLAVRRQWAVLGFLLVWLALMLGPIVLLSAVLRSRYTLAGAIPLLLAAAYLIVDLLGLVFSLGLPGVIRWSMAGILLAGAGILPIRELNRQNHDWKHQTLTAAGPFPDRYQYITGWTAGLASQRTIEFIRLMARDMPLVVITDDGWGTPSDALWVYLSRTANVRLYYISWQGEKAILQPSEQGRFLLRMDKWLYTAAKPVTLEPDVPVLFVTKDPIDGAAAEEVLRKLNPNLPPGIPFYGVEPRLEVDHVTMFHLR
jgi:4-amino-4-deoxy-L-arabinose transferase-like glycosyltransferase